MKNPDTLMKLLLVMRPACSRYSSAPAESQTSATDASVTGRVMSGGCGMKTSKPSFPRARAASLPDRQSVPRLLHVPLGRASGRRCTHGEPQTSHAAFDHDLEFL